MRSVFAMTVLLVGTKKSAFVPDIRDERRCSRGSTRVPPKGRSLGLYGALPRRSAVVSDRCAGPAHTIPGSLTATACGSVRVVARERMLAVGLIVVIQGSQRIRDKVRVKLDPYRLPALWPLRLHRIANK